MRDLSHEVRERRGDPSTWIRDWHRSLGEEFPCIDVDCLMIEVTTNDPVALIEYKAATEKLSERKNALLPLSRLATWCGLPAFLVRYPISHGGMWSVSALNDVAQRLMKAAQLDDLMPERSYVQFILTVRALHRYSGFPMPAWPSRPPEPEFVEKLAENWKRLTKELTG